MRLARVGLLGAGLAACASAPPGSERLVLESRSYGFVDELDDAGARPPARIDATLTLPASGPPPYPAVVILHSSIGQGAQDWHYARVLSARGFAVLAVDSFSGRGVERTVDDQTKVSVASMLADAYAALARLRADPRIAGERVALLGFSKGGTAALYAAFDSLRRRVGPDGARFAAHLAYYPWCGMELLDLRTHGVPILIQTGALDEIAPAELCRRLVAKARDETARSDVTLAVVPAARHAFDHPLLDWFPRLPVSGAPPVHCRFEEVAPGRFRETTTGRRATAGSLPAIFAECGDADLSAGGNPEAAAAAQARALRFLARTLAAKRKAAGTAAADDPGG